MLRFPELLLGNARQISKNKNKKLVPTWDPSGKMSSLVNTSKAKVQQSESKNKTYRQLHQPKTTHLQYFPKRRRN